MRWRATAGSQLHATLFGARRGSAAAGHRNSHQLPKSPTAPHQAPASDTDAPPAQLRAGATARIHPWRKTGDGLIVVDMHAAHERVVYQNSNVRSMAGLAMQPLLILVVPPMHWMSPLPTKTPATGATGFEISAISPTHLAVRGAGVIAERRQRQNWRVRIAMSMSAKSAWQPRADRAAQSTSRHYGLPRLGTRQPATGWREMKRPAGDMEGLRPDSATPTDVVCAVAGSSWTTVHARQ